MLGGWGLGFRYEVLHVGCRVQGVWVRSFRMRELGLGMKSWDFVLGFRVWEFRV